MHEYVIEFAGMSVAIRYELAEDLAVLDFLFADLQGQSAGSVGAVLEISQPDREKNCTIFGADGEPLFYGKQGVTFAAILFDQVIYHLLYTRKNGVALHAGAVSHLGMTILLPGKSGAGKSSVTAWMIAHGFAYLTDELVFLPGDGSGRVIPFPRPLCIKTGSVAVIKKMLPENLHGAIWEDASGAMIPHRLLHPDFTLTTSPPVLFLFPEYQKGSQLHVEKVSGARTSALLMTCDVNGRNLIDHGFRQLAGLARSVPAWRITYSSFADFNAVVLDLLPKMAQGGNG